LTSTSPPARARRSPLVPSRKITLVKVFSATTARARTFLGDQVMAWLASNPSVTVLEAVVTASSDRAFHCLSIVLLCRDG
jgi:hypothetical protein